MYAIACIVGVVGGYLVRGRLRNLADLPLRTLAAVAAALALQLAFPLLPRDLRLAALGASYALVALTLLLVWRSGPAAAARVALAALAAGWALNALVIGVNGGMPVSRSAIVDAGGDANTNVARLGILKHVDATSDTHVRWLGDIVPLPPFHAVASAGDFLLLAGIAGFIAAAMKGARGG